jgi:hypothetical protein
VGVYNNPDAVESEEKGTANDIALDQLLVAAIKRSNQEHPVRLLLLDGSNLRSSFQLYWMLIVAEVKCEIHVVERNPETFTNMCDLLNENQAMTEVIKIHFDDVYAFINESANAFVGVWLDTMSYQIINPIGEHSTKKRREEALDKVINDLRKSTLDVLMVTITGRGHAGEPVSKRLDAIYTRVQDTLTDRLPMFSYDNSNHGNTHQTMCLAGFKRL